MKKGTLTVIITIFIITLIYNIFHIQKKNEPSNLLMINNIEALASGESNIEFSKCLSGSGYCAIYWNDSCIFESFSHYPR